MKNLTQTITKEKDPPKKDYTVVIEATEVGDPTAGVSFRFINDDVTGLQVKITLDNPFDELAPQERTFDFPQVAQGHLVAICQTFSYPVSSPPPNVKISIAFSTAEEDTFTLAAEGGINGEFVSTSNSTEGNIFTNDNVQVGTPPHHPLVSGESVFIQCLEESLASKAFMCWDFLTGQITMKDVYTNHDPGMTWILREDASGHYYLELDNAQGNSYLYGNTQAGALELQNGYTSWKFLPVNAPSNIYQLKCLNNAGPKIYLIGDTDTGSLNLLSDLDTDSRAMKWYFHGLKQLVGE